MNEPDDVIFVFTEKFKGWMHFFVNLLFLCQVLKETNQTSLVSFAFLFLSCHDTKASKLEGRNVRTFPYPSRIRWGRQPNLVPFYLYNRIVFVCPENVRND